MRPAARRGRHQGQGVAGWWRRRWDGWWTARHPRSDQLLLTQHNVYILPTGAGWLFAALLLVLLLASINYQLNLGYLLTFGLAGVALSSMHSTHANLRGLRLQAQVGDPVFAGEMGQLRVTLLDAAGVPTTATAAASSPPWLTPWSTALRWRRRPRARHGIGLRLVAAPMQGQQQQPQQQPESAAAAPSAWSWVDLPVGDEAHLLLGQRLPRRGWHRAEQVQVETRYPFGLFRAWTVWRPATQWLAWPAAETPAAALPWAAAAESDAPLAARGSPQAGQEASGLRSWRRGDALTQVHWKKTAQSLAGGGDLVSRDLQGQPPTRLSLDWAQAAGLDDEQRLARLCAWVLSAEQAGVAYGLTLPGQPPLPPGQGPLQQREALHRLATWGLLPDEPRPTAAGTGLA